MARYGLRQLEQGKLYYSISEICKLTGLEPHVLRFWESEFPQLRPKKNRGGVRAYRQKDIQIIRFIKFLLYEERYTISGAKKKLATATEAEISGQVDMLGASPPSSKAEKPLSTIPEQQALDFEDAPIDKSEQSEKNGDCSLDPETKIKLQEIKHDLLNLLEKLK